MYEHWITQDIETAKRNHEELIQKYKETNKWVELVQLQIFISQIDGVWLVNIGSKQLLIFKKWQRLVVADLAIVKSGIQKKQNGQIKKKEEE